jgi:REP element-mobilizing transposase RayT
MSQPRQFFKGVTYLITRRCTQRQFLLRPSKKVNEILLFCLAAAAEKFGTRVHAFVFMSNHYHLVVTDPHGRLDAFLHWLNTHISRSLNAFHGRSENLFDTRQTNVVPVVTAADVLEKIVYVLANPVAAALVSGGDLWPGVRSAPEDYGRTLRAHKPRAFFRKEGAVEDVAQFELEVPPGFEDLTPRRFRRRLQEAVEDREAELRARVRVEGRRFLGARAVRAVSPFDSPRTPAEVGARVPRLACKDPELRQTLLARMKAFARRYREALAEHCAGKRRVVFPAGTCWMRVHFGVSCERGVPGWRIRACSG